MRPLGLTSCYFVTLNYLWGNIYGLLRQEKKSQYTGGSQITHPVSCLPCLFDPGVRNAQNEPTPVHQIQSLDWPHFSWTTLVMMIYYFPVAAPHCVAHPYVSFFLSGTDRLLHPHLDPRTTSIQYYVCIF